MKRIVACIAGLLALVSGLVLPASALGVEHSLTLRLYAPNYLAGYICEVVGYGVLYTDNDGVEKSYYVSLEEGVSSNTYANNNKYDIAASELKDRKDSYIKCAYVNVRIEMSNHSIENRTYYYNSDGTSSLFREGFHWDGKQDLSKLIYLDSPYCITIDNKDGTHSYSFFPVSLDNSMLKEDYNIDREAEYLFDADNKEVAIKNINEHVYIPLRSIAEAYKLAVDYEVTDTKQQLIRINGDNTNIILTIGKNEYLQNGKENFMDDNLKPLILYDKTYVPIRFFEKMGFNVVYSSEREMFYIRPRNNTAY